MAFRVRGPRTYFLGVVLEHRTVQGPDGHVAHEVVIGDAGKDSDQVIIRTPWRRIFGELPVGIGVDTEMLKVPRE